MKKIILILALMPLMARGQIGLPLKTNNEKDVVQLLDELCKITNHKLVKVDSSFNDKAVIQFLLNKNGSPDTIRINFYKRIMGGNEALEIKGHWEWSFTDLNGRYLDIFSIWKRYFNRQADMNLIAENGWDRNRDYVPKEEGWYSNIQLRKWQKNYWTIK
jgi:hypothetical protein